MHPHHLPPLPSCSFVHIAPDYHHPIPATMLHYAQQPAHLVFPTDAKSEVHDVWAWNLEQELSAIAAVLPYYPCVTVDTEFPGAVHDDPATPRYLCGPRESYALVKRNVDDLKLLQVGVALSGATGRFPVAWQFNIRGFNPALDPHAPASVAMLLAQGMDLAALGEFGIRPADFADGFYRCSLFGSGPAAPRGSALLRHLGLGTAPWKPRAMPPRAAWGQARRHAAWVCPRAVPARRTPEAAPTRVGNTRRCA
jgi:CCR4-NOT transcription complex subunit 7/8